MNTAIGRISREAKRLEQQREEYLKSLSPEVRRRIKSANVVEFLLVGAGIATGAGITFSGAVDSLARGIHRTPDTLAVVVPISIFIGVPLILVGIAVAAMLSERLCPMLAGPEWTNHRRVGVQGRPELVILKVIAGLSLAAVVFYLFCFTRFEEDGISWHRPLPVRHTYKEVVAVLEINGMHMHEGHNERHTMWSIGFDNGDQWFLESGSTSIYSGDIPGIMEMVAKRAGKKIDRVEE